MPPSKTYKKEGNWMVLRNSKGEIVAKTYTKNRDGKPKTAKESFREIMVKLTNNGQDQLEVLMALSQGQAITPFRIMEDGSKQYAEPVVPNATVIAQASKDIIEMMHGKAVAQTEVMAAMKEAKHVEQARALSDAELEGQLIEALAERGKIALPPKGIQLETSVDVSDAENELTEPEDDINYGKPGFPGGDDIDEPDDSEPDDE